MPHVEIVWLLEERVFGILVRLGTYFSLVRYNKNGMEYEVLIENDEFEIREQFDYEQE